MYVSRFIKTTSNEKHRADNGGVFPMRCKVIYMYDNAAPCARMGKYIYHSMFFIKLPYIRPIKKENPV